MVQKFIFDSDTRSFAIAEPLNDGRSISDKASGRKGENDQYQVIFKNGRSGRVATKNIKAKSSGEAYMKFKHGARSKTIGRGNHGPINIRLFQIPKQQSSADRYKQLLNNKS